MHILFFRYGSICEPDIISAFQELGHTIHEINEQIYNKDCTAQTSIQLVSSYLLEHSVNFVFSINFFPELSEVCKIFNIRYLCWIVDSPVMELYATSITNPTNRIFLFDKALYHEFAPLNPDCIFHLPLASNVKAKDTRIAEASASVRQSFAHEIAFVGSLYTEKCRYDQFNYPSSYLNGYLNGIMQAQLEIYGYYFIEELLTDSIVAEFKSHFTDFYQYPAESYLNDKITLAQFYIGPKITSLERIKTMELLSTHFPTTIYTASDTSAFPKLQNKGLAKTLTEMPIIFHESKINLNTTAKSIRSGLPLRIWDILASGGFVLSNFQLEISDYFNIGEHLDTYASMNELLEKCDYYLHHEKKRKEIAHCGYEEVKAHHTYEIRLEQMLNLAFAI